ncbi:RNA-binding protein [Candidatus Uhrbacteria bacterium CG_4_10_14_0_2_um_filter_41_7]|uniref:RNA-binding protein n=1 Tax=Candidatus Uhrbacteria bacterium CG_4_9_14_3_um_filter_41_35 TaxID=1975034 RepID=A0A2M7XFK5_9BACT|nr:MAG: RNA-binding protein [Candidatus Uhrbacteria bacterium CG11_big_fil_rev_8_21_14_0_20_41_9]PIZ54454.1 MAG: RNA-binding protein [Candidatus Uhrbacteria bacterium CG_4_10_14_0_2_um_filter_41_7]PJA46516.1 MAG: RNA-binding protein [Candidatus Uhrbacteria bacterium CG_4_9_14_3_um_filter_41_35]
MTNKLFIGNLPFSVNNDSLKDLFQSAGEVEDVHIIMDNATKRSKGYGFVTMLTEDEAQNAIKMLDGNELDGRKINVNIARPKEAV